ncbi:MAG: hypothetical protein GF364_05625 [Candidatus Lokiarchaeota archaeon]|nr:hypothetical protein [Candidatus Lokiarchaeota archaeon]
MRNDSNSKEMSKSLLVFIFVIGFLLGSITSNLVFGGNKSEIHINIIYSSEKASWMTIAYGDFLDYWSENHEEEVIIDMHPYGSSDSVISILNGEIFPTIWSPASSIWIPSLNAKWEALTGESTSLANLSESVRIIYSPIVIATWEQFNQTHDISGFLDLHDLCTNPEVDVKLAHTDPRLSNSGLMSVIMALSAVSYVDSKDLSLEDLTNETNQDWLSGLEASAVMYGKSTGFLARYMKSSGPESLTVAFMYENLVKDISSISEGGKVIAIYPEEGTLYSDHPFCILNADWITGDQRMVAEEFLEFLNQTDTVKTAMDYGFRPIDTSIPLDPEVFNYETNGIAYDLLVPEETTPEDGDVLLKIPDLWLLCKSTST